MHSTPPGWPRLSTSLYYENAASAIDWLCRAFGFEVRLKIEGEAGRIEHSELIYGEALLMICEGDATQPEKFGALPRSPKLLGGANTQCVMLFVDEVDAHCAHARAAGARIVDEPKLHDYGEDYWADRSYGAQDCDGHVWWFTQRIRNPKP